MIVKDLQKYINAKADGKTVETVGTANDPFLSFFAGKSSVDLEQHVGTITKFATNTGTQIFYEFLQNADDAKGSRVSFFFKDNHFIVINNGNPFFTDTNDSKRKGQLFSFLWKEKNDKFGDADSIGKYGQGSKLLYDLLLPNIADSSSREDSLIKTIVNDTKGVILFSWSQLSQWEKFKDAKINDFQFNGDPNSDEAILTKIVYTYYPAILGETKKTIKGEKTLFSTQEMQDCLSFISDLNLDILDNNGTLIYIPLGEGQAAKLTQLADTSLKSGIRISLTFLRNLKLVKINSDRIANTEFQDVQLEEVKRGDKSFSVKLSIPSSPLSMEDDFVNFYQYFPVTETIFGLKYIVHSDAYQIDGSRQRIDFEKSQYVITQIGENISKYICQLKSENRKEGLLVFIKCILATKINRLPIEYKPYFYDNLIETVKKNIPTTNGYSTDINEVRIKSTALDFIPSDLGVSWQWLDTDLADSYEKVENILGIKKATILDVLRAVSANNTIKIIEWVKSLSVNEYVNLVKELADKTVSLIANIPFIRCSDGEVRSINGIHTLTDIGFLTPNLKDLKPVFDKLALKYTDISLGKLQEPYESKNITKVVALLNDSTISDHYDKWTVFDVCKSISQVPNLKIFENQLGEKRSLSLLLHNSSNLVSSGVLKRFAIKPSEVDAYRGMNAFMMKPEDIWESLISEWNLHVTKDLDYIALIKDLNTLYNKRLLTNTTRKPENTNTWIKTDTGEWAKSSEIFFCPPLSRLSQKEYAALTEILKKVTDLKTIPFEDIALIDSVKFSKIPSFNFNQLKDNFNGDSISITKRDLDILMKIKNGDSLLDSFVIQGVENEYQTYELVCRNRQKQYIAKTTDTDLINFLKGTNYVLLPSELNTTFLNDANIWKESDEFILKLIQEFGADKAFVDLVIRQGQAVKEVYISKLSFIEFNSKEPIESYKDTFEGKAIGIAVELGKDEDIRKKIQIDGIALDSATFSFKDSVNVSISDSQKVVFSLSELLSEFAGQTDILAIIRTKISKKGKVFDAKPYPLSKIEQKLILSPLTNAEQFAFLIAFYKSEEGKLFRNRFAQVNTMQLQELTVLDSLVKDKRNLYFYTDFSLPREWFNPNNHIDCEDSNLILSQEKVLPRIVSWISSDKDKRDFLHKAGLINEQSDVIALRKGIFRGDKVENSQIKGSLLPNFFVQNTIDWVVDKQKSQTFSRYSNTATNILQFIKEFVSAKQTLPNIFITTNDLDNYTVISTFDYQNLLYINGSSNIEKDIFNDTLQKYNQLKIVVNDGFKEILERNSVFELKFEKKLDLNTTDFNDWVDPCYQKWRESDGSKYKIYVSTKEIPFEYSFKWKNIDNIIRTYGEGKTERHPKGDIIELFLFQENNEDLYALLMENMQSLFGDDAPILGKLMGLRLKELIEINSNRINVSKINGDSVYGGNGEGNVFVEESKKEIINDIKDLKIEVLNKVKELGDEILKFGVDDLKLISESDLEQLKQEKEKEEKSTPSELIGRIGEELAMKWLAERDLEPEHVAVTKKQYEYDILVPKDETGIERYIDVKTTTKSVIENDASVPLHIHKHAMKFLEAEADRNYFIIRISMGDLGIDHWNTQLKDKFNFKGKDRKLSDELIEAIRVKVNEFWEKPKNQKLFEKTVKEFRLTIPKMVLTEMDN